LSDSAQGIKRSKEKSVTSTPKTGAQEYNNSIGKPIAAEVEPRVSAT
jgi:hypothetical protein